MAGKTKLDLSELDNQLLDGLDFCQKVYDLFDRTRSEPEGSAKLRVRSTKNDKRLIEELLPLARYTQYRYRAGRRIKVLWLSGSQPYDAIFWSSGLLVKQHMEPRKLFVEVTTSVHQNDYLARQLVHEGGVNFGVKGIFRDKKSRGIISKPDGFTNKELVTDLADQIVDRLKQKSAKRYSPHTVLVVNCIPNILILDDDWSDAIKRVAQAQAHLAFREVFLLDMQGTLDHSATLWGKRNLSAKVQVRGIR